MFFSVESVIIFYYFGLALGLFSAGRTMDFKAIQALTADDMVKVNETIHAQLNSEVSLINQLGFLYSQWGRKASTPSC